MQSLSYKLPTVYRKFRYFCPAVSIEIHHRTKHDWMNEILDHAKERKNGDIEKIVYELFGVCGPQLTKTTMQTICIRSIWQVQNNMISLSFIGSQTTHICYCWKWRMILLKPCLNPKNLSNENCHTDSIEGKHSLKHTHQQKLSFHRLSFMRSVSHKIKFDSSKQSSNCATSSGLFRFGFYPHVL